VESVDVEPNVVETSPTAAAATASLRTTPPSTAVITRQGRSLFFRLSLGLAGRQSRGLQAASACCVRATSSAFPPSTSGTANDRAAQPPRRRRRGRPGRPARLPSADAGDRSESLT